MIEHFHRDWRYFTRVFNFCFPAKGAKREARLFQAIANPVAGVIRVSSMLLFPAKISQVKCLKVVEPIKRDTTLAGLAAAH